jgi:Domain of unknown function (DUF4375)
LVSEWFDAYDGQTTEALLELEGLYRTDSLVLAFEEAIQRKAESSPISKEERYILAVEALEREVNNGGYDQFFRNLSHDFIDVVTEALVAIGCPKTAAITDRAIKSLGVQGGLTGAKGEAVILADDDAVRGALGACDSDYCDNDEPIADLLFAWIKNNRAMVRVGDA